MSRRAAHKRRVLMTEGVRAVTKLRWTTRTATRQFALDGTHGSQSSGDASIGADGREVAFLSSASNLVPVPDDTNFNADVFVRDRTP